MSAAEGLNPPKVPWKIEKIKEEANAKNPKLLNDDWPSLGETSQKLTALTLETKGNSVQINRSTIQSPTESVDSGNGGELIISEKSLNESTAKLCDSKWPSISSSEDGQSTSGASSSSSNSHDEGAFPELETRKPQRNKSRSSENGSSISSDEITESDSVPQQSFLRKKKSSKPNWIPLTLPDLPPVKQRTNFKHRTETRDTREKTSKPIIRSEGAAKGQSVKCPATATSSEHSQGPARGQNSNGAKGHTKSGNPKRTPNKHYDNHEPYLNTASSSTSCSDYMDYSPDFATFSPVYPGSEFIMPYLGNEYFPAPVNNTVLITMLRNQIEYYFSEENLAKDFYLRRKMDCEGYLPIHLIASFQRVQTLTQDFDLVMEAVLSSGKLEVNQGCVRTVQDPLKWPIGDTTVPISPVLSIPVPCVL